MSKQINEIKCPECRLINWNHASRCRRCGNPLSQGTGEQSLISRFWDRKRSVFCWAIPVIAMVLVPCLSGLHKDRGEVSVPGTAIPAPKQRIEKSIAVNRELEEMKQLQRDFITRLDQNMDDHTGAGLNENQTLAFNMMRQLKERENKYTDPAALEYLKKFYGQVRKYYDQLVQYNSDSAHLAEFRQRIQRERNLVLKDTTLSPEDRRSKLTELWDQNAAESQLTSVSTRDIEETVRSLRDLSADCTVNGRM
jgi:hypothetical protein